MYFLLAFLIAKKIEAQTVTNPIDIHLMEILDLNSSSAFGGAPVYKSWIYVSYAGSTNPQLYTFDTGGEGINAAYSSNPSYTPLSWGTNFQVVNPTNNNENYGGGGVMQYTLGGTVSSAFTLFNTNSSGGYTQVITSPEIIVAQFTNETTSDSSGITTNWPANTTPPWHETGWGDFGMKPILASNGAGNPLAQLQYSSNVVVGYMLHLGVQDFSTNTAPTNAYVQIGLSNNQRTSFHDQFYLLSNNNGQKFPNTDISTYQSSDIYANLTLSNSAGHYTNIVVELLLDSGGSPMLTYNSTNTNITSFLTSTGSNLATVSLVASNTSGQNVNIYSSIMSTNFNGAISIQANPVSGYNGVQLNIGPFLYYQNDVAWDLQDGIFALNPYNGGTNVYSFSLVQSSLTVTSNNQTTINPGVTINNLDSTEVTGGTLIINGTIMTPVMEITGGMTSVSTNGSIITSNKLSITNGTLSNSGTITTPLLWVAVGGTLDCTGDLYVGNQASGNSMVISNGGSVNDSNGFIGFGLNSSNNSVLVIGYTSLWSNSGSLTIGAQGARGSALTIANAGQVQADGGIFINSGRVQVSVTNGLGSSTVTLGGTGSTATLSLASNLTVSRLNWGSNGVVVLTPGSQILNVSGVMSNVASGGGAFSFANATLNNATNVLISFISQSGFTPNSFSVVGVTGYSFLLTATNVSSFIASNANLVVTGNNTVNGSLQVGSLSVNGGTTTVALGASLISSDDVSIASSGTLTNEGTITTPILTIGSGGVFSMLGGTLNGNLNNTLGGTVVTDPSTINGNVTNAGTYVSEGADVINGNVVNSGTFTISGMTMNGGLSNSGTFSGYGTINAQTNGVINSGTIEMSGMVISGSITNSGFISGSGTINGNTVNSGTLTGSQTLTGSLTNTGTVLMSNMVINAQSGGVSNSGLISGTGTINGNTFNSGTLTGSQTLNGNLTSSGTVTPSGTNSPIGTITVNGNLTLQNGSTLTIATTGTTNSSVNVSGTTTLAGTLVIAPTTGTTLSYGQKIIFMSAASFSGSFTSVEVPTGFRGRVKVVGDPQLEVIMAPQSYTQLAGNRNQSNVATALNSYIPATSGDRMVISTSLDSLTAGQYNQAFNAIMPTFYQQMATIAFNEANALNMELNQRLWGVRLAEGGGFSMSGLADNYAMLQEGQGDGKSVLDAKKDILRPGLDNHWGMFVDGNGIFAQANSANMLPGYNSESGGVTTGLTYKWSKNMATGIYTGYQGTYTKSGQNGSGLGTGSSLIDNAVRYGVFGTYGQDNGKGLYANALAGGAYHNYQATRVIQYTGINRTANSSPGAGELDSMLATGYDIQKGNFTFGPTASLQYTYLGVNSLNETGAQSLNFNSGGWNSSSMLSSVGAHAAYTWIPNTPHKDIVVVPQISLNWQHEFMQNPYAISGNLGGTSPSFSTWSATPIRDFLYTGVGFTVEFAKRWNTSFFYNAAAGNSDLVSQNIFWSAGVKF
jgi:fibronectin-binding autotransporter adhesin